MKDFRVDALAQRELEDAAAWYETQRDGLGFEFIAEVDRVLIRIAQEVQFATAPIATVEGGVVRREFVHRFPRGVPRRHRRGVRQDRGGEATDDQALSG